MQQQHPARFQFGQIGGSSGQDVSTLDSARGVMSAASIQHGNNQFVQRQAQGWQLQ